MKYKCIAYFISKNIRYHGGLRQFVRAETNPLTRLAISQSNKKTQCKAIRQKNVYQYLHLCRYGCTLKTGYKGTPNIYKSIPITERALYVVV